MIKRISRLEEVKDFVLELSLDASRASFPRLKSSKEVVFELEHVLRSKNHNLIGCYQGNKLCGVCAYYCIPEEKYAQTTVFLIASSYKAIALEMMAHLRNELPGFQLIIGVTAANIDANDYLQSDGFECVESCAVTTLDIVENSAYKKFNHIEKITQKTIENYAPFHDKFAVPQKMFFNSRNLRKDFDRFRIYASKQNNKIQGSTFVKVINRTPEIFGLFVDENCKNDALRVELLNELMSDLTADVTDFDSVLYFIEEENALDLEAALSVGFKVVDEYKSYKTVFAVPEADNL